jgi:hypothetical protein
MGKKVIGFLKKRKGKGREPVGKERTGADQNPVFNNSRQ